MNNINRISVIFLLTVAVLLVTVSCSNGSTHGASEYERAQKSVGHRIRTGDFSNMSPAEKKAFNDYLDWDSNN